MEKGTTYYVCIYIHSMYVYGFFMVFFYHPYIHK